MKTKNLMGVPREQILLEFLAFFLAWKGKPFGTVGKSAELETRESQEAQGPPWLSFAHLKICTIMANLVLASV